MKRTYSHLSLFDRALIQTQLQQGWRAAAIAAGLQRARSTITREMRRNGRVAARFSPDVVPDDPIVLAAIESALRS